MSSTQNAQPAPSVQDEERLSYEQAMEELSGILEALEADEVSIDELAGHVERGAHLVALCRDRLSSTRTRVSTLVEQLAQ